MQPRRWAGIVVLASAATVGGVASADRTAGTSSRYLKWNAPRGNAGKPPPKDDEWPAFNGRLSAGAKRALSRPSHKVAVPLSGVRPAAAIDKPAGASSIVGDLVDRGMHPRMAPNASTNVMLGIPSDAKRGSNDDLLVAYKDRVISYSNTRRTPNWVGWKITEGDLAPDGQRPPRNDASWRADPSLPRDATPAVFHDYERAGFDPGHMVASGDRQSTSRANIRTYVTSNTVPQAFNNNGGPWVHAERWIRDQVRTKNVDAHIIAGGSYGASPYKIGSGVSVPSSTWKIVVLVKKGAQPGDRGTRARVIALDIPNDDRAVNTSDGFQRYLTTPAEIERKTGLRFFTNVRPKLANAWRKRLDPASDVGPPPDPFPNR